MRVHCRNRAETNGGCRSFDCAQDKPRNEGLPRRARPRAADPTDSQCDRLDAAALHYLGAAHGGDRSDPRFNFGSLRPMKKKTRVDQALVERGTFKSLERAHRAIMAGGGRVGDRGVRKAAELIEVDVPLSITDPTQFAR